MSRYKIIERLGNGGMGDVYRAHHSDLNVDRCIKILRPELKDRADLHERFRLEARSAARLRHPNLVAVHEFAFGPSGTAYLVMEFVKGVTLLEAMSRQGGRLKPDLAVEVGIQSLRALHYLHECDLIHRDVSPNNIILTAREGLLHVVLIDLGIVKDVQGSDHSTREGAFFGKLAYASPEQLLDSGSVDYRSDLYSMGVVLFQLAAGSLPRNRTWVDAPTKSDGATNIESASEECLGLTSQHAQLEPVLSKAMAADPDQRFSTAAEFMRALEDLRILWHLELEELKPQVSWIATAKKNGDDQGDFSDLQADLDAAFPSQASGAVQTDANTIFPSKEPNTFQTVSLWMRQHPKPSLTAVALLLLLVLGSATLATRLGRTIREGDLVTQAARLASPPPVKPTATETQPVPTENPLLQTSSIHPATIGLMADDAHLLLIIENMLREALGEVSSFGSLEEAEQSFRSRGNPKKMILLEVSKSPSAVVIRGAEIPRCDVMVSARVLELSSGRQLSSESLFDSRINCPTALNTTSRALVEKLLPKLP